MISFFRNKKTALTNIIPNGFVDIHAHLLPGIDDGAKSMEETMALIKTMRSYGIKKFIATPHVMEGVWENTPAIIQQKLTATNNCLKEEGLYDVTIGAAAEYMLDAHFEQLLKEKQLLTLKDNIVLVELSYQSAPLNLYDLLFKIQVAGYKPLLAHPERYSFFHNNYKEYQKLKAVGCLFQLNLLSLSNYYGRYVQQIAIKLLKDAMFDFVGTDTHHLRHLDFLKKITDKKTLKLVTPLLQKNSFFS